LIAALTFTYDRKNRLKSHTHSGASDVRGNLWYDGQGRVWQRWTFEGIDWATDLTRFVYDGALAQEQLFDVSGNGTWTYAYNRLMRDYLRQPAGIRERVRPAQGSDTDYFLMQDQGSIVGRFTRGSSCTFEKAQRGALAF